MMLERQLEIDIADQLSSMNELSDVQIVCSRSGTKVLKDSIIGLTIISLFKRFTSLIP